MLVNELARVIGFLRKMVENTANEMKLLQTIRRTFSQPEGKGGSEVNSTDLLEEFEVWMV